MINKFNAYIDCIYPLAANAVAAGYARKIPQHSLTLMR